MQTTAKNNNCFSWDKSRVPNQNGMYDYISSMLYSQYQSGPEPLKCFWIWFQPPKIMPTMLQVHTNRKKWATFNKYLRDDRIFTGLQGQATAVKLLVNIGDTACTTKSHLPAFTLKQHKPT